MSKYLTLKRVGLLSILFGLVLTASFMFSACGEPKYYQVFVPDTSNFPTGVDYIEFSSYYTTSNGTKIAGACLEGGYIFLTLKLKAGYELNTLKLLSDGVELTPSQESTNLEIYQADYTITNVRSDKNLTFSGETKQKVYATSLNWDESNATTPIANSVLDCVQFKLTVTKASTGLDNPPFFNGNMTELKTFITQETRNLNLNYGDKVVITAKDTTNSYYISNLIEYYSSIQGHKTINESYSQDTISKNILHKYEFIVDGDYNIIINPTEINNIVSVSLGLENQYTYFSGILSNPQNSSYIESVSYFFNNSTSVAVFDLTSIDEPHKTIITEYANKTTTYLINDEEHTGTVTLDGDLLKINLNKAPWEYNETKFKYDFIIDLTGYESFVTDENSGFVKAPTITCAKIDSNDVMHYQINTNCILIENGEIAEYYYLDGANFEMHFTPSIDTPNQLDFKIVVNEYIELEGSLAMTQTVINQNIVLEKEIVEQNYFYHVRITPTNGFNLSSIELQIVTSAI